MSERVDPNEPVPDEESEGRLDGAEDVAEAHAELMVELVKGNHLGQAGLRHERVQADLSSFVIEPGLGRHRPVTVEIPVARQPVVAVALQDGVRVGIVAAVHAPPA